MEAGQSIETCRVWLSRVLADRKTRNPAYSLAAFSRALGISTPSLCQILAGKRPLSRKSIAKIVERLGMTPEEREKFLKLATEESLRMPVEAKKSHASPSYEELTLDKFQLISNWYYYAILSLAHLPKNEFSAHWVAEQIGIPESVAKKALLHLEKMELIKPKGKGFVQTSGPLWVSTKSDDVAIRKFHSEVLRKSQEALEEHKVPLERFTSFVMAVDEKNLEKGRSAIRRMRDQVGAVLEKGTPNRVYALCIQLVPLSQGEV